MKMDVAIPRTKRAKGISLIRKQQDKEEGGEAWGGG